MKRGITVLAICTALVMAYFTASKWAIHHQTLTFNDVLRGDRVITVDLAVRRDREMQSLAAMAELPVAIISHGNTVKNTEYSFLANVFAARGYMVASIQHDLDTDDPMATKIGEEYVGRRMQYNRGIANIIWLIDDPPPRLDAEVRCCEFEDTRGRDVHFSRWEAMWNAWEGK